MVEFLQQKYTVISQGLTEQERKLTVQNYVDFLAPSTDDDIYLPFNTLTPSELAGMSQAQERLLRKYGCLIISKAGQMLKLP
jgi:hypothetical protein